MTIFHDEFGKAHKLPKNAVVQWRPSIYGVLRSGDGKILLVQPWFDKKWILPGGGLEIGETIAQCLQREFYEETGYKVAVSSEIPLHVGERNFYWAGGGQFYHALYMVYPVKLLSPKRDAHMVNTVEKDEIQKMEWVHPKDLNPKNCHYSFWPYLKTL